MLNKSKGNMYPWITHTINYVKGKCYHNCTYCYMKQWGELNPVRFDEKELKIDLGNGNFIFVGSSCDMFTQDIRFDWIERILDKCNEHQNSYLFQSKNPELIEVLMQDLYWPIGTTICTTIETNRFYKDIMRNSPIPKLRAYGMNDIAHRNIDTYVTIEPIMDFDLKELIPMIETCLPKQVNLGADSKGHKLPEPPKEKILELITELEKFTKVKQKTNLKRLLI